MKAQVCFENKIEEKHLCDHDNNHCYFCKSNILVIHLIVGYIIMIKISNNMSL